MLAPVYMNGVGCRVDLEQAMRLVTETGADLDAANDRTRHLVADPSYRRTFRIIEQAARFASDLHRSRCGRAAGLRSRIQRPSGSA